MRPLCVLAFTVLAATAVLAQQAPTFKSGTRIVPVIATVTGAQGRLVPNLEAPDPTSERQVLTPDSAQPGTQKQKSND
jgi:hypothetical protein